MISKSALFAAAIGVVCSFSPLASYAQEKLAAPAVTSQAPIPAPEVKKVEQYLNFVKSLRTACDGPAWTLWHSNGYQPWRKGSSPSLSLNYSSKTFSQVPEPPSALSPELQQRFKEATSKAAETLNASRTIFKDLADYINASDYKDDKFKKGDELNGKLEGYGKTCFGLMGDLQNLYVETAAGAINGAMSGSPQAALAKTMMSDWEQALQLSAEMAKGQKADMAKIGPMVMALSELVEKRKNELADEMNKPRSPVKNFYINTLNDRVTVPMRRLVREVTGNNKAFQEVSENRPRSTFVSIREEIDIGLPGEILSFVRQ